MDAELRILVADDDESIAWLWTRILQWGFGAEVVAVSDGDSAVAQIGERRFDLIITDLQMPGASGLDVLRRANASHPRVPVVIATGYASDDAIAQATGLGAREIVRKPFGLDQAVAIARAALGHAARHCSPAAGRHQTRR